MTIARNHHLFIDQPTYFHLISRCVRRAFLCGKDNYSGKRYDHRKRWLEKRLFELCELFYIDLYGYAIMSNHYHLVVQTRPDKMHQASNDEIARRWCELFPNQQLDTASRINELLKDSDKIQVYRQRLCDISWLMRCLNEKLARKANQEDKCTGRFWQGRFRSQLLLDESAVYVCMAYVDLNPVRAGVANTPEQSLFTSIHHRITHHDLSEPIQALNNNKRYLPIRLSDYLTLVDETGRRIKDKRSGYILDKVLPILRRLNLNPKGYLKAVNRLSRLYYRMLGPETASMHLCDDLGLKWLKGQSQARLLYISHD